MRITRGLPVDAAREWFHRDTQEDSTTIKSLTYVSGNVASTTVAPSAPFLGRFCPCCVSEVSGSIGSDGSSHLPRTA